MSDFISTSGGKIINVDSIAFLTSRTPAPREGEEVASQLIVGFSAATSVGSGSMMPLSLVMEGEEAYEFLDQLGTRGVVVDALRAKIS
jgi:hypothetical protein